MKNRLMLVVCNLILVACATSSPGKLRLHEGLGDSGRVVSTRSAEAQAYFDQGLALCWGFNHDEAVRAFEEAARLDPGCAMAWWGGAYALGPNINLPLTDDTVALRAHQAAQKAFELAGTATPVEKALIEVMSRRYADPVPADRSALDLAYADAMRDVWRNHPDDAEVGVLFADSLMLLSRRWRQWPVDGDRGPHTDEIVATLQRVLAASPDHPGVNHFYIHAVEASTRPGRALAAADFLTSAVPAAGHLVHMPSHIYIRLGKYKEAVETNRGAVTADDGFFSSAGPQGTYHYYRAHNAHFLIWAGMFLGAREEALVAAREMAGKLPMDQLDSLPRSIESYLFIPVHVMMRFGMWQEILAEPVPLERYPVAGALWHHARAVAYANTGRVDRALIEAEAFERLADTIPQETVVRGANVGVLIDIARYMMRGEVLFKQGKHSEAFVALRKAVEVEDTLPYSEPPGWMQPIRHALGALLLEAGELEEAEAVYRRDLEQHAENGWSLHGLAECLRRTGRTEEAEDVERRFEAAWAYADVQIEASCFCRVTG